LKEVELDGLVRTVDIDRENNKMRNGKIMGKVSLCYFVLCDEKRI
jgi:hypothetical protein